jgi:hypothetical protein
MHIKTIRIFGDGPPMALVLGTGDIASAIGRVLFTQGWSVVQLRDPAVPGLRRGMAFDDALENGFAELDGIWAIRATAPEAVPALAGAREGVVVTDLDVAVFAATYPGIPSVLIDARMRKYATAPDLRPLASCTIGIGPGFSTDTNVDLAIETLPGHEGGLVACGQTAAPTGRAAPLGGVGEERFVYAPGAGPFAPHAPLGGRVEAGSVIGFLGERALMAPIGGCIRGMVRAAPGGVGRGGKLAEIDPRVDAPWSGVPPRARRIAAGVRTALDAMLPVRPSFAAS